MAARIPELLRIMLASSSLDGDAPQRARIVRIGQLAECRSDALSDYTSRA